MTQPNITTVEMNERSIAAAKRFNELRELHPTLGDSRLRNIMHAEGIPGTQEDVIRGQALLAAEPQVTTQTLTRGAIGEVLGITATQVSDVLKRCPPEISRATLERKIGKAEFWKVDIDALLAWYETNH